MPDPSAGDYRARTAYVDSAVVGNYENLRFGSRLGRYVWKREQAGVGAMLDRVRSADLILDVPSGIGRWLPALQRLNPSQVVEADISPTMLAASRANSEGRWIYTLADAEQLVFPDRSFDLVFCHALTKHLPHVTQAKVLAEFARVTDRYVISSFGVAQGLPGLVRKVRRVDLPNGVTRGQVDAFAAAAGLRVVASKACTTPIGAERSILFERLG